MTQMQPIRIIKKLNVWVMPILTLNIMRNCGTPGRHWNLTATLTGAGGFSSFHLWQVYVLNETCREASSRKQRHNQLQDLSAVPSEVTENKLMPIQKPKPLLIPSWTNSTTTINYCSCWRLPVKSLKNSKTEKHGERIRFEFPAAWAFSSPAPTFGYQTCWSAINQ